MKVRYLFQYLLVVIAAFGLVGCLKHKTQTNMQIRPEDINALRATCASINANGNMMALRNDVDAKRDLIFKLLESNNPNLYSAEVSSLVTGIGVDFDKLKLLSRAEWVNTFYPLRVTWVINVQDLSGDQSECEEKPCGSTITGAKLQNVFIQGRSVDPLKSNVVISSTGERLIVEYTSVINPLEYCQLEETFNIVLAVQYNTSVAGYQSTYRLDVRFIQ